MNATSVLPASGPAYGALLLLRSATPLLPRVGALTAPLAGLTAAWSGLLLLPLPFVPFSHTVPSLALGIVDAGLGAGHHLLGWLGRVLSGGYTFLLVLLGEALSLVFKTLLRHFT